MIGRAVLPRLQNLANCIAHGLSNEQQAEFEDVAKVLAVTKESSSGIKHKHRWDISEPKDENVDPNTTDTGKWSKEASEASSIRFKKVLFLLGCYARQCCYWRDSQALSMGSDACDSKRYD